MSGHGEDRPGDAKEAYTPDSKWVYTVLVILGLVVLVGSCWVGIPLGGGE